MQNSVAFTIADQSHAGAARRFGQGLARQDLGFGEAETGKISLVITELATNLLKHASGGTLLFRTILCGEKKGLEILALDKGPGIANIAQCLRDGYSTAGSPGTGLGAIQRLSALFEICSVPGIGTAILTTHWSGPLPKEHDAIELGAVCIPAKDELVCGDGWASGPKENHPCFLVVDGLGHGPVAADAAETAVRLFGDSKNFKPAQLLLEIHEGLRLTRGAAAAFAQLDAAAGIVEFAGIGNISAVIVDPELKSQSLVSHNGTLGGDLKQVRAFAYAWKRGSVMVMHSDGISNAWQLGRYPGLLTKHPSLIAGVLYRDCHRAQDDATVLVFRERR